MNPLTYHGAARLLEVLPRSGIREMAALSQGRPGLIHLEFGEPSFMTPPLIRQAAAHAIETERMTYTPTPGPLELREAIAQKVERINGYPCRPEEVFVTHGATGALLLAQASLLNPGDKILFPDPGWPNPISQALSLGAQPEFYPLPSENGYIPDPSRLTIPKGTKAILINSPANPTGAVFPREVLEDLAALARREGLFVISDEAYDQIYFEKAPVSMRALYPEGTLAVYSFSKSFAMTGWRLGYLVGPEELLQGVQKVAEAFYSSTSMVAQKAALAGLKGAAADVEAMRLAYRERRDQAIEAARELELYRYTPEGAFYLMVDVAQAGDSREFAKRLLLEKRVVAVPGTAFGKVAARELRLSLAASSEEIREGLERIRQLLQEGSR
ncbi:MAG: aminotransferase class I/II-fold pyridoxal phosphate-dependent enzyme [Bacillota bacterium]|nr:aminotransferase class I/II-fold pyridoxal phosphate-dependent enzyme [Bacillota bacterium]